MLASWCRIATSSVTLSNTHVAQIHVTSFCKMHVVVNLRFGGILVPFVHGLEGMAFARPWTSDTWSPCSIDRYSLSRVSLFRQVL